MTQALRALISAQDRDHEFPYMDFLSAFALMEQWILHGGKQALQRLSDAGAAELLGLPLSSSPDDLKLGYVMRLLRSHGLEVLTVSAPQQQPVYN